MYISAQYKLLPSIIIVMTEIIYFKIQLYVNFYILNLIQLKSTASELQSVKAEMIELMKTSESKLNALKEELNSKMQKTEMQLAEKQNELTNQTDEITSLKKELDKVCKRKS